MNSVPFDYAVLSFCGDLTSPSAVSSPVAVVGVSPPSGIAPEGFWFFVSKRQPGEMAAVSGDPIAVSILNSLPSLLERQLAQGASEVSPEHFLHWLHDRFRNTLFVSGIAHGEASLPAGSTPRRLMEALLDVYEKAVLQDPQVDLPNIEVRNMTRCARPVAAAQR